MRNSDPLHPQGSASLAPFALPLRREADAVIADANGQTVLIIDPSRNLDEDAAEGIADLVFARLTAAPVREEGGVEDGGRLFAEVPLGVAALYRDLENDIRPILATREEAPDWTARTEAAWAENNREEAPADHVSDARQMVEAPAEAGESSLVDWFSRFVEAHQEGCGPDTDALIACLDRVRDSYRAQPQAREEAQPVAVKALVDAALTYISGVGYAPGFGPVGKLHEAAWAVKRSPLYTTPPAPEAERLRVAAEALEKAETIFASISRRVPYGHSTMSDATHAAVAVRQALAALQQEGSDRG